MREVIVDYGIVAVRMDGSFDDMAAIPGTSTQATPPATPPNPGIYSNNNTNTSC